MSWNRPSERNAVERRISGTQRHKTVLISGIVILIIALTALLLLNFKSPTNQNTEKPRKPLAAKIQTTKAVVPKHKKEAPPSRPKEEWDKRDLMNSAKRLRFSVLLSQKTNSTGMVTERYRLPDGTTWRRVIDPPPIFTNAANVAILRAIGDLSGAPIPPVPGLDDDNLDEAFIEALNEPIRITDNDKPNVAALKMLVKEVRDEIDQMYKNGEKRSLGRILQDHINLNNHTADVQGEAYRQFTAVREKEGDEVARQYLEKVNETLGQHGFEPIAFPEDNDTQEEGTEN